MSPCTAVYGIFVTPSSLEAAVDALISGGLSCNRLSLLMSDKGGWQDFTSGSEKASKSAAGAEACGVVGGLIGLLLGLGALVFPGCGPLVAAGPIMASLAGLSVGGAFCLVSALVDLGLPEFEAKLFDGRLKDGAVLLSAHCLSIEQVDTAKEVLKANGAEDVASSGEEEMDTPPVEATAMF
jgi:hypothetical protein